MKISRLLKVTIMIERGNSGNCIHPLGNYISLCWSLFEIFCFGPKWCLCRTRVQQLFITGQTPYWTLCQPKCSRQMAASRGLLQGFCLVRERWCNFKLIKFCSELVLLLLPYFVYFISALHFVGAQLDLFCLDKIKTWKTNNSHQVILKPSHRILLAQLVTT